MILGMTGPVFIHVVLSLIGLLAGFVVIAGLLSARREDGWTALFLVTTVLTSVTGFFLPATHILPSHIVGIISLVVLLIAIVTRYVTHLSGASRWLYVGTAVLAQWLNFFVLIAQAFLKVPALHALAPTGSEPPFMAAQVVALLVFIWLGLSAVRKFKPV